METDYTMRRRTILFGVLLALLALIAWAWWDGGEEPLRPIAQPVSVPEAKG